MLNPVTLHTADGRLSNAWKGLVRRLQTTVEATRLTNAVPGDIDPGTVVFVDTAGPRLFDLADSALADSCQGVGVVVEPIATGGSGIVRTDNVARVKFITGIVGLAAGDPVYVSAQAGRAVNAPGGMLQIYRIGTVFDASTYVGTGPTNSFAYVLLDRCCTPQQVP